MHGDVLNTQYFNAMRNAYTHQSMKCLCERTISFQPISKITMYKINNRYIGKPFIDTVCE